MAHTNGATVFTPRAYIMSVLSTVHHEWLLDNGASHDVTSDFNALSFHAPYIGNEELVIGDGTSLPITHIGSMFLRTPLFSFKFINVLCVPNISIYIISLSRLCMDKFFSSFFIIKEHSIHKSCKALLIMRSMIVNSLLLVLVLLSNSIP